MHIFTWKNKINLTHKPSFVYAGLQARIYDNKVDPCGPVYITIGDGGNREGLALT